MAKTIPHWLSRYLNEEGRDRISEAVRRAEQRTCGEIVPMIVRRSCAVGHVAVILFLLQLLVYWTLLGALLPENLGPVWAWDLAAMVVAGALSLAFGRALPMQRLLTLAGDEIASVNNRAQLEFHQLEIRRTKQRTGILIFVSLMEHRAVVLADHGIAEKMPVETWQDVVTLVIEGVRRGDFAGGMVAAVDKCGELLAQQLPIRPGDHNELADLIVIKE